MIRGVCANERGGFGEEGTEVLGRGSGGKEGEGGEEGCETHLGGFGVSNGKILGEGSLDESWCT